MLPHALQAAQEAPPRLRTRQFIMTQLALALSRQAMTPVGGSARGHVFSQRTCYQQR